MTKMISALMSARLGSEFDAFLFAPVGDEGNGHSLSVISALARLDLDPWQEAASLANMPAIAATQKLTSLIASLPGGLAHHFAPAAIATRLAGLLPSRTAGATAALKPDADDKLKSALLTGVVFFLVVLGWQWMASNKLAPAKVDSPATQNSVAKAPTVHLSR